MVLTIRMALVKLVVLVSVMLSGSALSAGFTSFHQYPYTVSKTGTYEPVNYTGFKNEFNPNDPLTACQMGLNASGGCAFPMMVAQGEVSWSLPYVKDYRLATSFKFYLTEGTYQVIASGFAPQGTQYAFAVRLYQEPQRTTPLTADEYSVAMASDNVETTFTRLVSGEEIIIVHDGGGTIRMLGGQPKAASMTKGGWLYVRQLQPATKGMFSFSAGGSGDWDKFLSAYKAMAWDNFGDPVGVTPTPTCVSPQVLQSGQCVTPTQTCVSPQVLQNGQCVTPTPTCVSPQSLQNGQCVTPTPSTSFSLSQTAISLQPGASTTLNATNGLIEQCISDNESAIKNASLVLSPAGDKVTIMVVNSPPLDNPVLVRCFSTTTPSDEAKVIVTISLPATTAFTLSPIKISKLNSTNATITAKVSTAAKGYWVALPIGFTTLVQPTAAQIEKAIDGSNNPVPLHGEVDMLANVDTVVVLDNLTADTNYQVYFYAKKDATNGIVENINVATIVTSEAEISAIEVGTSASSGFAALTMSIKINPGSNHIGKNGKYYVAAFVPPGAKLSANGGLFFRTENSWTQWTGGEFIPYSETAEPLAEKIIPAIEKVDISGLAKTSIYGAYQPSAGNLIFREVYIVP